MHAEALSILSANGKSASRRRFYKKEKGCGTRDPPHPKTFGSSFFAFPLLFFFLLISPLLLHSICWIPLPSPPSATKQAFLSRESSFQLEISLASSPSPSSPPLSDLHSGSSSGGRGCLEMRKPELALFLLLPPSFLSLLPLFPLLRVI